ncbi:meiotic nuclear division protein 1 homolog [Stomoxys calcitrans]|uniref:meiotic nuclear division protein 1 homolog n=1 Tax=Stomoxys calcitrans TaxID=35570 RepID=UPI0027E3A211|nr:meiotic nuclear division protein 1 homolog [Stomoxys calcitrans]
MSKRKPLSAEEKRIKLLELFHETGDVYQLKDLERLATQEKGIVMQAVKTTLQELVDEGQVQCEKIAGSLYYWSFPSETLLKLQRELSQLELRTSKIQERIATAQSEVQKFSDGLDDKISIESLSKEIEVLREEREMLAKQEAKYSNEVNYEEINEKNNDAKKILDAANRWTDNIFMIKTWCKRNFDKEDRELNKAFGIPEDLDYMTN